MGCGRPSSRFLSVPPVTIFEGEVGRSVLLTDLEDLDDIGVMQSGDRLGLGLEPHQVLGSRPAGGSKTIFKATIRFSFSCFAL